MSDLLFLISVFGIFLGGFSANGCYYREKIEKSQVIYIDDQGYKCEKVK